MQPNDLCVVARKYKDRMFSRKVFKDDEEIDCVPVLRELKLTPHILGNLKFLNERWCEVKEEVNDEIRQLQVDKADADVKRKEEGEEKERVKEQFVGCGANRRRKEGSVACRRRCREAFGRQAVIFKYVSRG